MTQGGSGWLATAQGGCDVQFGGPWGRGIVVGAFVDGDWSDMSGRHTGGNVNIGLQYGVERLRSSWAVGGRAGVLVTPQLLTYVSGGYTEAAFESFGYVSALFPLRHADRPADAGPHPRRLVHRRRHRICARLAARPVLEERVSLGRIQFPDRRCGCTLAQCGVAGPTAFAERNRPSVQTVRTELVWRFNWGGSPVAARY